MNDIKLAMLGSKEAAKRLTEKGVLVPCPMCADTPHITIESESGYFWYECSCGVETGACPTEHEAMFLWNTRSPILSKSEMEMLEGME